VTLYVHCYNKLNLTIFNLQFHFRNAVSPKSEVWLYTEKNHSFNWNVLVYMYVFTYTDCCRKTLSKENTEGGPPRTETFMIIYTCKWLHMGPKKKCIFHCHFLSLSCHSIRQLGIHVASTIFWQNITPHTTHYILVQLCGCVCSFVKVCIHFFWGPLYLLTGYDKGLLDKVSLYNLNNMIWRDLIYYNHFYWHLQWASSLKQ
jgi:hypothetical protein